MQYETGFFRGKGVERRYTRELRMRRIENIWLAELCLCAPMPCYLEANGGHGTGPWVGAEGAQ